MGVLTSFFLSAPHYLLVGVIAIVGAGSVLCPTPVKLA